MFLIGVVFVVFFPIIFNLQIAVDTCHFFKHCIDFRWLSVSGICRKVVNQFLQAIRESGPILHLIWTNPDSSEIPPLRINVMPFKRQYCCMMWPLLVGVYTFWVVSTLCIYSLLSIYYIYYYLLYTCIFIYLFIYFIYLFSHVRMYWKFRMKTWIKYVDRFVFLVKNNVCDLFTYLCVICVLRCVCILNFFITCFNFFIVLPILLLLYIVSGSVLHLCISVV